MRKYKPITAKPTPAAIVAPADPNALKPRVIGWYLTANAPVLINISPSKTLATAGHRPAIIPRCKR